MLKGSCLCGGVSFELTDEPVAVSHCHCKMCRKQHGAAFVFKRDALHYITGEENLSSYNSSADVVRTFCKVCGSNIEWRRGEKYAEWVSIAVASFDTEFKAERIEDIYLESRVCWLM